MRTFSKKATTILLGTVIVGGSFLAATPAYAADVSFADPALQGCVNTTLGQAVDAPVSEAQAVTVTDLTCNDSGITSIEGLQALTNLNRAVLTVNQISDLTPLAGLTQLRVLLLTGNQISDVTALSGLTQLTNLDLAGNQITSVAPLAGLTNLEYAFLHFNQISDVSPLAGLVNVRQLLLLANRINDVSPLAPVAAAVITDPTRVIDVRNQSYVAPEAFVRAAQKTPITGFASATNRVAVSLQFGDSTVAPDGMTWVTNSPGMSAFAWSSMDDARQLMFSGSVTQFAAEPALPTLHDDAASTLKNTQLLIDVLGNDGEAGEPALDPTTLMLLDGGAATDTLTVPEGTFTVDAGKIEFVPASGFVGDVPPVTYTVRNIDGGQAAAEVTVSVLGMTTAKNDEATTPFNTPVTVDVLANDGQSDEPALDAATLLLRASDGAATTSVDVAGGTYSVVNGKVRFAPTAGFAGSVPSVTYEVENADGVTTTALVTVTVEPAKDPAVDPTPTPTPPIDPIQDPTDNAGKTTTNLVSPEAGGAATLARTGSSDTPWLPIAAGLILAAAGGSSLLIRRAR